MNYTVALYFFLINGRHLLSAGASLDCFALGRSFLLSVEVTPLDFLLLSIPRVVFFFLA